MAHCCRGGTRGPGTGRRAHTGSPLGPCGLAEAHRRLGGWSSPTGKAKHGWKSFRDADSRRSMGTVALPREPCLSAAWWGTPRGQQPRQPVRLRPEEEARAPHRRFLLALPPLLLAQPGPPWRQVPGPTHSSAPGPPRSPQRGDLRVHTQERSSQFPPAPDTGSQRPRPTSP